ncbi:hypothetical protein BsWGS_17008 [Bradybaena similaris]
MRQTHQRQINVVCLDLRTQSLTHPCSSVTLWFTCTCLPSTQFSAFCIFVAKCRLTIHYLQLTAFSIRLFSTHIVSESLTEMHWCVHRNTLVCTQKYTAVYTEIHWCVHRNTLVCTQKYTGVYTEIHWCVDRNKWCVHRNTLVCTQKYTGVYMNTRANQSQTS